MKLAKTTLIFLLCSGCITASAQQTVVEAPPPDSILTTFEKVEVEASFRGGQRAWADFISRNIKADVPTNRKAPAGSYTAIVQFIVDRDGNITDIKALTNLGFGMEEELIRVISKSPRWKPAMQNGRTVKAYRRQPLTFVVEEEKKKKNRG